jgi:uncharacterized protein
MNTKATSVPSGAVEIPVISNESEPSPRGSVLFVHGIFSEKTEDGRFSRLAAELASDGLNSWQFDYVGHGDSHRHSRDFTVASAIADFLMVAQAHRRAVGSLSRFLIASSFGGSVVLLAAVARHLADLGYDRVVLLNPVSDYRSSFLEPFGPQMQEIFTLEALRKIRAAGEAEVQPGFTLGLPALVEFELLHPADGFRLLDGPTLLLQGDQDTAVSHDVVLHHSSASPFVEFHTIHGASHAFTEPQFERATFDMMRTFLRA